MSDAFRAGIVSAASIGELKALQDELARLLNEVDPAKGLGDTVQLAAGMLHRYATGIVHVDTGRLKNSLFWDATPSARRASAIMGTNLNYSIYENARGGSHAFMDRTEREEGPAVAKLFNVRITGGKS